MNLPKQPATIFRGDVLLPTGLMKDGCVVVRDGRIAAVGAASQLLETAAPDGPRIDAGDGYIAPGFVDIHVHGGGGADFMDGTDSAFETVLACHARHGTTSIVPTTTVARHEQIINVLGTARRFKAEPYPAGARVLGVHFYGPYFRYEARGAHPAAAIRPPQEPEYREYLQFADAICTATVAPEIAGAREFALACAEHGIRTNAGHSWATFAQMAEAVAWGVRHVDHLYCAMSDKARLRQFQSYPMRGGVLEATLYFDELTTELIADGMHLSTELMLLALKIKGVDRLALITDCNRALDMPEGLYMIGPMDGGEPFLHRGGAGLTPDGTGLASSVRGMDHMVRTFVEMTGRPLWEAVRMATLTPAKIVGRDREIGSLETGKRADLLVVSRDLDVQRVFIDGVELPRTAPKVH